MARSKPPTADDVPQLLERLCRSAEGIERQLAQIAERIEPFDPADARTKAAAREPSPQSMQEASGAIPRRRQDDRADPIVQVVRSVNDKLYLLEIHANAIRIRFAEIAGDPQLSGRLRPYLRNPHRR
jgi:hypothetical protein